MIQIPIDETDLVQNPEFITMRHKIEVSKYVKP
jgi:hypothetical protein